MVNLGRPVYITVRAVTNQVGNDIRRGLRGAQGSTSRAGEDMGKAFTQGFNRGVDTNVFRRVANGIRTMVPEADAARAAFQSMIRTGYTLGTALVMVVGGISSVISSLGALIGSAGGAISTISILGNAIFALGAGMIAAKLAFSGVGGALKKLQQQTVSTAATSGRTALQAVRDSQAREAATRRIEDAERSLSRVIEDNRARLFDANNDVRDAQVALNNAIRAGREELQQLGFEAEDAAIAEQKAAVDLERARETLARVQDLPPNNRARREAELAFAEAELNYRKAKDANADLAKEQDRLAKSGVNGLGSVIDARDRLAKAEADKAKTIKNALESEEDATRNLTEAKRDAAKVDERQAATPDTGGVAAAGAAGQAWDQGLNDAQREFVLFLNGLRPQMEALSAIAAAAFLPKLTDAIKILMNGAYPVIATGIGKVAAALGNAAVTFATFVTSTDNLRRLEGLFSTSAPLIETFGTIAGRAFGIILSILERTAPIAQRFFDWVAEGLATFDEYLNTATGNFALGDFFARAEYSANQFGDVFGNIFGGIGAIIQANIGPNTGGALLLDWLDKATSGWSDSAGLQTFFLNVATNATKVLDTLTDLVGILGRVGENQNIGKAFETLLKGGPALESILQKTADAAPFLADLVVTITEIVDALTDTGAIEAFLGTLNEIATWVRDFIAQPAVKGFLDFFGRIFASMSAVGLVLGGVSFGLKILLGVFATMLGPVATVVGLISKFRTAMMLATAATSASAAATGASTAATTANATATGFAIIKQKALMVAQKAAAAAQWLFNAALTANPIGIIVAAIAALVAGLVWFFTQTDLGREIWANFTKFLGEAWENTTKWIGEALTNLGNFFSDVWDNIVNGINAFVGWVWDIFLNWTIYGLIIKNWDAIVAFFQQVWANIMGFFDAAFKWIDTWVIQPMIKAFQFVGFVFDEVGRFIGDVWRNIQNAINAVWQWIDRYIFAPIRAAILLVQLAFAYAGAIMQKAWTDLQAALDLVWKWIDANIFGPIKTAVGLVQQAFENVADGIAKAWDGIKKAAAVPINFVIDTVYNNGLRSFWNDIADNLNMKDLKLPKAKTVAFASGGVMPGYSPGKDIHKFWSPTGGYLHLSGGEAIMRPEWTRMMGGPAAIARMNRAAMRGQKFATGGVFGAHRVQRFANGGTTTFAGDLLDGIGDFFGVIGDFFANPLEAVQKHLIDGLVKPLLNNGDDSLFGKLIGGVPIRIAENIGKSFKDFFGGFAAGKGTTGMGWQAMSQLVTQMIPGARITSAYRSPGANAAVGGAKGSYHMQGRAVDVVPATMDTFNRMLALFPNARELIFTPAGSRQLLNGKPFSGWSAAVKAQHYNHVHAAMANGGTVHPRTGGSIVQVAEAGRAERIEPLDANGISKRDEAIIDYMSNGAGGTTINVYQLPGEDQEALAERLSRILSRKMRKGGI